MEIVSTSYKTNKYDKYILLLIASLVCGNLFSPFQVPRILALMLSVPCLSIMLKERSLIPKIRSIIGLFFGYCILSLTWTPASFNDGLVEIVYHFTHCLLFFELIVFSTKAQNPLRSIALGFLVCFAISAIIASWEIVTDRHLSVSKFQEAKVSNTGLEVYTRYFSAVTFVNFNMYVTFVCAILPFLFYGMLCGEYKKTTNLLFTICIIAAIVLVLFNASRGGLLSILVMVLVFFFKKPKGSINSFLTLLGVFLLFIVLYYYGERILSTLLVRQASDSMFADDARMIIWSKALQVFYDYFGVGCGVAGMENAMQVYMGSGGITVAHNIFLEIAAQYGLFFIIVYLLFLHHIYKQSKLIDSTSRCIVYMGLFSLPFYGIINSHYLTQPVVWAVMASLYVYANICRLNTIHNE